MTALPTDLGKTDTFVLDFANGAEDIQDAFRPFYDSTLAEPTDPNLLYTASARVDGYQVINTGDVTALVTAYLGLEEKAKTSAHAALYKHTEPALDRHKPLNPADREEFRSAVRDYVRQYAFLAQILPYTDSDLEALYIYCRFLLPRLPREQEGAVDLGDDVVLAALRVELTGTFDVSLGDEGGEQVLAGFTGGGAGPMAERKQAALSTIIELLNDRFGTNLGEADLLFGEQGIAVSEADPQIRAAALANDEANFAYVFDPKFLDQPDFADLFTRWARGETYRRIRQDGAT